MTKITNKKGSFVDKLINSSNDNFLVKFKELKKTKKLENLIIEKVELIKSLKESVENSDKHLICIDKHPFYPHGDYKKLKFQAPDTILYNFDFDFDSFLASQTVEPLTENDLTINLYIKLPCCIFDERDFLNYIYFNKKTLYLQILKDKLKKRKQNVDLDLSLPYNPFLTLHSTVDDFSITFRIMPDLDLKTFPKSRFNLNSTNLRSSEGKFISPRYNQRLLGETRKSLRVFNILNKCSLKFSGFKDVCLLIDLFYKIHFEEYFKKSLKERSFNQLNMKLLLAYLLQKKIILTNNNNSMFLALLEYICGHDLETEVLQFDSSKFIFYAVEEIIII